MSKEKYSDASDSGHKKTAQPSKLVSLGAAANYTGNQQQQNRQQKQTDQMTDLFGNISVNPKPTQQPSQFSEGGFADFESAFSSGRISGTCKYPCIFLELQVMLQIAMISLDR